MAEDVFESTASIVFDRAGKRAYHQTFDGGQTRKLIKSEATMNKRNVIIIGAAGRDFHSGGVGATLAGIYPREKREVDANSSGTSQDKPDP